MTFNSFFLINSLLLLLLLLSCDSNTTVINKESISIIPQPQQVEIDQQVFLLNKKLDISLPNTEGSWKYAVDYLSQELDLQTEIQADNKKATIIFIKDITLQNEEAYALEVEKNQVKVAAKSPRGAFYAVQSLLQMIPITVLQKKTFPIEIPTVHIKDAPRFKYRGMHLDVGRHFFSVKDIKKFIDVMAKHKYNKFHWHLTEDQGWRIEIKQYPKLTSVGAYRKETLVGHMSNQPYKYDGKPYGGFYTQEEVKEIVAYAQKRFITVIPEIELPGHAQAAIAAYPELGCSDKQLEVRKIWGVSENVYCPTETTFKFLENVLSEVIPLFSGEYFHIGGDECPKEQWKESAYCQRLIKKEGLKDEFELQSYFIKRIEKFLNSKGKRLIGWDEILEGGLAPNATVMSWRGMEGGIEAAKEGHDVIMTPTSHCYFDYYQSLNSDEPLAIGGFLPIEMVYEFEPVPAAIPAAKKHHIIGGQANIWTEYMPTFQHLEYMAFPRAIAMSEVLWTEKAQRNLEDFTKRLTRHFDRLDHWEVNAARSFFDVQGTFSSTNGTIQLALNSNLPTGAIHYTIDGSMPKANSTIYKRPIAVEQTTAFKAAVFENGQQKGKAWTGKAKVHKALGKTVLLSNQPAEKYGKGGTAVLVNGIDASKRQFNNIEWLGFEGKDFEAIINLGEEAQVKEVVTNFFQDNGAWVYGPKNVTVLSSSDGVNFQALGDTDKFVEDGKTVIGHLRVNTKTQYLKVVAKRFGLIPAGNNGEHNEAWLFVGEIEIN